jgi:DNA-binding NarL/FixJ family response regulator
MTPPGSRKSEPPKALLSVMLVDDHPMWRETLGRVIEHSGIGVVVAEADDGPEAVEVALRVKPDLVVMDMALPTMSGVEATRRIRHDLPAVKVLVLSSLEARSMVLEAVRAGASGYLLKTAGAKEVAAAVRKVALGEMIFPPKLAKVVLEEFRRMSGPQDDARRVALAGDSVVHREGLARVLVETGFDVTIVADDVEHLVALVARADVDVVVLDMHASPDKGAQLAAAVRDRHPSARMLVLASNVDQSRSIERIAGWPEGIGYLLRDGIGDVDELRDAIKRVASGGSVIDPAIVDSLVSSSVSQLSSLTERETEVLGLMAEGRSNQAITDRLFLSAKTLEKHIRSIFTKLGLDEAADDHRRVLAVVAYLRSI